MADNTPKTNSVEKLVNPLPPWSFIESCMVRLEVGSPAVTFMVHKDLICYYSKYFDAALNGNFQQAHTQVIKLDDEEPKIVTIFFHWMYFRQLYQPQQPQPEGNVVDKKTSVTLHYRDLIKTWAFGDRREIPTLQNAVLDACHLRILETWNWNLPLLPLVYNCTTKGSKFRNFFIEHVIICRSGVPNPTFWKRIEEDASWNKEAFQEFTVDLCKRVLRPGGASDMVAAQNDRKAAWMTLDVSKFYVPVQTKSSLVKPETDQQPSKTSAIQEITHGASGP